MAIFAPKTVNVTANVPTTIVWSAIDLQNHLGEYPTTKPMSLGFNIINPSAQAVYIGLSYRTLYETVPLLERRSFGAIASGASSAISISAKSISALANIKRDVVEITLTLTSLAASSVTVTLEANYTETSGIGSASSASIPVLGLDAQTAQDYTPYTFTQSTTSTGLLILVPTPNAGTKIVIEQVFVFVERTAYEFGAVLADLYLVDTNTFIPQLFAQIQSYEYEDRLFELSRNIEVIAPFSLRIDVTNTLPYAKVVYGTALGKTVLI